MGRNFGKRSPGDVLNHSSSKKQKNDGPSQAESPPAQVASTSSSKKKPQDNEIKESAKKQKKITDARDSASSCLSYLMSEQSSEGRTTNEGGGEEKNVGSSDMPLSPKVPDVPEDLLRALEEGFAIRLIEGRWQKVVEKNEDVTKESIETDFGPCPGYGIMSGKCRNRREVASHMFCFACAPDSCNLRD